MDNIVNLATVKMVSDPDGIRQAMKRQLVSLLENATIDRVEECLSGVRIILDNGAYIDSTGWGTSAGQGE
jgi:hypothetical protein